MDNCLYFKEKHEIKQFGTGFSAGFGCGSGLFSGRIDISPINPLYSQAIGTGARQGGAMSGKRKWS